MTPNTPSEEIVQPAGAGDAYWLLGDLYTIKSRADQTGGRMSVVEAVIWPGHGSPPHIHPKDDETFYILEGRFEVRLGDKTVEAGPGSFVHLPAGGLHCYTNVGDRPGKFIFVCTPGGFEQMFIDLGRRATQTTTPPPFGEAEVQALIAAAPRYGLKLV